MSVTGMLLRKTQISKDRHLDYLIRLRSAGKPAHMTINRLCQACRDFQVKPKKQINHAEPGSSSGEIGESTL
jgi:hypothetical protein